MNNDWSDDIESVLDKIRKNCTTLSSEHTKSYFRLKKTLHFFRLPVIVLSGINSVISVGSQQYLQQNTISATTCVISLICSIICSVELFLGIQKKVESELTTSKEYNLLATDIQKTLLLSRDHRPVPSKDYLEKVYSNYLKLAENSNIVKRQIKDELIEISLPNSPTSSTPSTPKSSFDFGLSAVLDV